MNLLAGRQADRHAAKPLCIRASHAFAYRLSPEGNAQGPATLFCQVVSGFFYCGSVRLQPDRVVSAFFVKVVFDFSRTEEARGPSVAAGRSCADHRAASPAADRR